MKLTVRMISLLELANREHAQSGHVSWHTVQNIEQESAAMRHLEWLAAHPAREISCGSLAPDRRAPRRSPQRPTSPKTGRDLGLPAVGGVGWE